MDNTAQVADYTYEYAYRPVIQLLRLYEDKNDQLNLGKERTIEADMQLARHIRLELLPQLEPINEKFVQTDELGEINYIFGIYRLAEELVDAVEGFFATYINVENHHSLTEDEQINLRFEIRRAAHKVYGKKADYENELSLIKTGDCNRNLTAGTIQEVKKGMTYFQIVDLLGCSGLLIPDSPLGSEKYVWSNFKYGKQEVSVMVEFRYDGTATRHIYRTPQAPRRKI